MLPFGKYFGQNPIKTLRLNLGLKQNEFAELLGKQLNKNLTKKDISRWENCEHLPRNEVLIIMANLGSLNAQKFIQQVKDHFETYNEIVGRKRKYATNN